MRVVLANLSLVTPGGTEVHLVTVGEHLQRLGHEVVLYAADLGPFADHARRRGLEVRDSVQALPEACDVVFAQDAAVAYDLAERHPESFHVFRLCSDVYDFELPPQVPGIVDLVVVLSDRYERLAKTVAVSAPILRLRVPIDVDRLEPHGAIRDRAEVVVLLGNYAEREALLRGAWGEAGLDIRRVGVDTPAYELAPALADADIVVAKSRAALDAMSCGRAVYVYDLWGGDGWVTPELYPALEADNFAGLATDRVLDRDALAADLADYRRDMGTVNRDLVLQHHNPRQHVVDLLGAIGERAPQERASAPLRELARLTALQWSSEENARTFRWLWWGERAQATHAETSAAEAAESARQADVERDHALQERDEARRERDDARRERDEALVALAEARVGRDLALREQEAMKATRAWRLANVYRGLRRRLFGWARRRDGALSHPPPPEDPQRAASAD